MSSREHAAPSQQSADAEPAAQAEAATAEQQASFQQQSLSELGVDPKKRKAGAPSARDQSRGEMGAARAGVAGSGQAMPHADKLQAAFGKHDVGGVRAHVGGDAADASEELGAEAYAMGDQIAFADQPDLHTAAHEAAHVVQQRAGKVGGQGVGAAGDAHEKEADQVADAVVAGDSAEPLLDHAAGDAVAAPAAEVNAGIVQRKTPKDEPKAFVPEFLADDIRANMHLGETYEHQVRITNAKDAPKGTKYHWSHSISGPSYRLSDGPEKAHLDGEGTYYPFDLRGVGTYSVVSKVKYGVGADVHEAQTRMEVVVDKPTKHQTEIVTEKDGKKRPFAGSMLVGEDLVVTMSIDDLRRGSPKYISKADTLENVRAYAVAPGIDFKSVKALTHGVYEIRLHASRPGGALGQVAALPFDTKLGDTPIETIRPDIQKADDAENPDARPGDFAQAKGWLKSDYDLMFREMHTGNQSLLLQTQVNDPPPKQSIWVDILLGAVSTAFGGLAAGISLAVAKKLIHAGEEIAAEAIQEGVKSFMEQSIVAAATATFSKGQAQSVSPHVAFYSFMESAINKKQRDFEQLQFTGSIVPKLDEQEKKQPGSGFSEAMRLDRAMKAEAPSVAPAQFDNSFVQWIKFVTKAQLGETKAADPSDPMSETGTDMKGENTENWKGKLPETAGVIQIDLGYSNVYDPKTPVVFGTARMPGMNQQLREKVSAYKVKDLPFAVRVHGSAPGRYDGSYTFSRNEQKTYWLSKNDHEYLEKKSGSTAEEGAKKILEQEIGNVQMPTPDA